jgi:hypothetical protein
VDPIFLCFFRVNPDGTADADGVALIDRLGGPATSAPPTELDPRLLGEATVKYYRDNVAFGSCGLDGQEYRWHDLQVIDVNLLLAGLVGYVREPLSWQGVRLMLSVAPGDVRILLGQGDAADRHALLLGDVVKGLIARVVRVLPQDGRVVVENRTVRRTGAAAARLALPAGSYARVTVRPVGEHTGEDGSPRPRPGPAAKSRGVRPGPGAESIRRVFGGTVTAEDLPNDAGLAYSVFLPVFATRTAGEWVVNPDLPAA